MVPFRTCPSLCILVALATLRTVVGGPGKASVFLTAMSPLRAVVCCIFVSAIGPRLTLFLSRVATILADSRVRMSIISLQVFCILTWWGPMVW